MKCWKCGQALAEGAGTCPYCGVKQKRSVPVSETGKAMRAMFDHYGAQTVLSNEEFLANGLDDLPESSRKLRNQLSMAMEAGVGQLYLKQLAEKGPDAVFDHRVRTLLTEEAGLNAIAAAELEGLFDEMIGWRSTEDAGGSRQAACGDGRSEGNASASDKAGRSAGTSTQAASKKEYGWQDLYAYEKAFVVCLVAAIVLGILLNRNHDPAITIDYFPYLLLLIPLVMSFGVAKDKLRVGTSGTPEVITVITGLCTAFAGYDLLQKNNILREMNPQHEGYLWQQHMKTQDSIVFILLLLLLIVMFRHRLLEKRNKR